jgi:tetratricopeptide (TPR) repeat protein
MRGLHVAEPGLVMEIDAKLLGIEDDVVARRIAFGWNERTPELWAHAAESVASRLDALAAAADRGAFLSAIAPTSASTSIRTDDRGKADVHGKVGPNGMTEAEALALHEAAVAVLDTSDPVSQRLNAAAKLMLTGAYADAAAAFRQIAETHPEVRGDCFGNIGAAHYFVGRYDEAIAWYQAAIDAGADAQMMQDNIVEARQAIT